MTMARKIGVMGCGVVADYGHLPALERTPGVEVQALFDPDAAGRDAAAKRFGVPVATGDPEVFFAGVDGAGLDAVLVASSAPAHAENVMACAARGLPVLCEKPLAMDDTQGLAMIDAMAAAGASLHVAFCYRFSAAALEIKRLVEAGAIGEVGALRLIYNWDCHGRYNHRDPQQGVAPYRDGRMREGGPMVDCGTHQIDLAAWWLGRPVQAWTGHGAWTDTDADYHCPAHIWAHLTHAPSPGSGPQGRCAHTAVEMSYGYGHTASEADSSFKYELIGSEGVIVYDRNPGRFELRNASGITHLGYHQEKDFDAMHQAWARLLETGDPGHLATAQEALTATRIALDVTAQAASAAGSTGSG